MSKTATKNTKITAEDVARRAGVSRWTVSRALTPGKSISEDVRTRVLAAADELGYRPNLLARSLSTRKTQLVAVVADDFQNLNLLKVLGELTAELQKYGLTPMLINVTDDEKVTSLVNHAEQLQADGIIFFGATLNEGFIELANSIKHIPLVVLYRECDHEGVITINTDDFLAGQDVAALQIKQGATRFAYLSGPAGNSTMLRRFEGYHFGLKDAGLDVEHVFQVPKYHQDLAFELILNYFENTPPKQYFDAIFCENDTLALGVLDAIEHLGLSNRVSVVGFDDIPMAASAHYGLTSVAPPVKTLTEHAVQTILGTKAGNLRLPGNLSIRQSHLIKK